ncbi:methyltransferase [Nocardia sp. NPDC050712]|uniref:methyltransferase n=1 Tax=Nocardia sp. NPDC050712 TaxID=3155518 RepID=UPI0034009C9A
MTRSPLADVANGYMSSQIIHAAAELEIADLLADGPRSSAELAAATSTHSSSLLRLLRALVALGVLAQSEPDRFELTELGNHLRKDAPDTIRDVVRYLCSPWVWASFGGILHSLRTGDPAFDHIHGMPGFDYLAKHPAEAAKFNAAMSQMTRETGTGIVADYDFSAFPTVVDVGGGNGTLMAEILGTAPDSKGIVFDTPSGVSAAQAKLEAAGVADRVVTIGGDFFESVPAGGDAYVMKYILHDWNDEKSLLILRNIRKVIEPTGKLIVFERAIPELIVPDHHRALLSDLLMLVLTGGRERTVPEYRELFAATGFELESATGPLGHLGFTRLVATPA